MKRVLFYFTFALFLLTTGFQHALGQSKRETLDYILDIVQKKNQDFTSVQLDGNDLVFSFINSDGYIEKLRFEDMSHSRFVYRSVLGDSYFVYDMHNFKLEIFPSPCLFVEGPDDARKLYNAINHLKKIAIPKDPFDY